MKSVLGLHCRLSVQSAPGSIIDNVSSHISGEELVFEVPTANLMPSIEDLKTFGCLLFRNA